MIETQTLIRWTHDLVRFVNGDDERQSLAAADLFTAADANPADWAGYNVHWQEKRTPEQTAATRKRARVYLAELSLWAPSKTSTPKKLVSMAQLWLNDPLVRGTHWAEHWEEEWTPMDGVMSLAANGRLQLEPRFRSPDAQYAATFAELIQEDAPAMVKRCDWCAVFFVIVKVGRGRGAPGKLCDPHYEEQQRTKKRPACWPKQEWTPTNIVAVHHGSGTEFRFWYEELPNPLLERCDCKLYSDEPRHYRLKRKHK